jgi:hypothetical protein
LLMFVAVSIWQVLTLPKGSASLCGKVRLDNDPMRPFRLAARGMGSRSGRWRRR